MKKKTVDDFIKKSNGNRLVQKVLIANNGMAAVKAIRSIRKWSYETFGSEDEIQFYAMCTPEDLKMNAEYIRMADHFIEIPGGASHNNYSNVDLIVELAELNKVHAVYVGWGFASENPVLADRLADLGIVFIGPPASAMRSLGDKIASTIVAQSANVPCVNWSGQGITITDGCDVPDELYKEATITTLQEGLKHAERIGFPVMIKASEGGGGKGIRLVYEKKDFSSSFLQVQREVPGSPIFVMQVVQDARHLEVQLLADSYGNAIALFGRDCSVQRRHQKIIEEAPVTIAPPEILRKMEQSAVNLAKLVGYKSAGTVEYLYEPSTRKYYFLELNPRLQVEHPTTEMVSGVNIPAAQLQIAMGIPLSNIKDIRLLYGLTPTGTDEIDFDFEDPKSFEIQRLPHAKGHVIATRITAENPEAGFKPNSGRFLELNFKSNSNVWGYFSVNAAGGVHEYADSQFGHLFAYGETREEARRNLVVALKEISIRGDFRTTVEYLVKLLENEVFKTNEFTTSWLDKLIASNQMVQMEQTINNLPAVCGAIGKASLTFREYNEYFLKALAKGQVPSQESLSTKFNSEFIINNIQYRFVVYCTGPESLSITHENQKLNVVAKPLSDGGILVVINGKSNVVYLKDEPNGTTLVVDGSTFLMEKENDPTQLRSPSPGKLIRYLVKDGEHIFAGDSYAEIEVMKMYMPLVSKESGVFNASKPVSSVLSTGDIIATLVLDDPSAVKKAIPFQGNLPFSNETELDEKIHYQLKKLVLEIDNLMNGFEPRSEPSLLAEKLIKVLEDPELPLYEIMEVLGSINSRIPAPLSTFLYDTCRELLNSPTMLLANIPEIQGFISKTVEALSLDDQDGINALLLPIVEILNRNKIGLQTRSRDYLLDILKKYYDIESLYESTAAARVILKLRDQNKDSLEKVLNIVRAHSKPKPRSELVLAILDHIERECPAVHKKLFANILDQLAQLGNKSTNKVSFRAREILIGYQLPGIEQRKSTILNIFSKVSKKSSDGSRVFFDFSQLSRLIVSRHPILDILPDFFFDSDISLRAIALYTYVMRTNQAYTINYFDHHFIDDTVIFSWNFSNPEQNYRKEADDILESPVANKNNLKKGVLFACKSIDEVVKQVKSVLPYLGIAENPDQNFSGYVTIVLNSPELNKNDELIAKLLAGFIKEHLEFLKENLIKRVTFMIYEPNQQTRYFTFKATREYQEDVVIRHIEPFMSHRLELERLSNFHVKPCPISTRGLRIYHAVGKSNPTDTRFFIRGIIHPANVISIQDFIISEANRITIDMLNTLDLLSSTFPNTDCNHILLQFIPIFDLPIDLVQVFLEQLLERHRSQLCKLRVSEAEICFLAYHPTSRQVVPFRLIIDIPSEYVMNISWYTQLKEKDQFVLQTLSPNGQTIANGPHHGQLVHRLHAPKHAIQPKRYKAHLLGTTFVYDFPALFEQALKNIWKDNLPKKLVKCVELVLNSENELEESTRLPGSNNCGMVVFKMDLYTPEYPRGRQLIVIANDITYQTGSFGPLEDLVFLKGSQMARKLGLPRIYLSANSGARIGLADEILSKYKIAWIDASCPQKGFEYLYVDESDYQQLNKDLENPSVKAAPVAYQGKTVYKLEAVIGQQHGLGVENLQGSGMIAGETSRAYKDIFTLTLVTCRSVGIGAYLVRLGQRVIQVDYTPIILTGAAALNKVLGRQVYASNLQLGGPRIMYHNGVSHLTASNDFNGIQETLKWLSYVPEKRDAPLPIIPCKDSIHRKVEITIPAGAYNPRVLLEGGIQDGKYKSGFFDRHSFKETLGGWAQGIVVGRARLGGNFMFIVGIPMGVISVETRATETVLYADPANETSQEEVIKEAGQVWYPNSAFKTAQAIKDFNYGEQLPLIIFANWRGFSGGQSDMSKEVLKFGAEIVDALTNYKQPIFIYIVGELRGGAWVVVDPSINPEFMEMYSYEDARGGVLEPEGIVEIKYRTPKVITTMERLQSEYKNLLQSLEKETIESSKLEIGKKIKDLETQLLPVYHQAAIELADLHDRPSRMYSKKVIREIVQWQDSRQYFYYRLARRIKELAIVKEIASKASLTIQKAQGLFREWIQEDVSLDIINDDQQFVEWIRENQNLYDEKIEQIVLLDSIEKISGMKGKFGAIASLLAGMSKEDKKKLVKVLE
ncbi:acetyl-coenzyme-A carboxylase [Terramyces sp. JEL0728]|nr:acetyl-coenzyme-A carboxylase [Terramyces sp. JEL0728]